MCAVTDTRKDSDKCKYEYSGYGNTCEEKGEWNFHNDPARNVQIFGVDNSSSYANNHKNNFLVLGEGPTFYVNGSFDTPEQKININFSKAKTTFCLSLHCNGDNNYLFINRKKIFKFETNNENVNFQNQF